MCAGYGIMKIKIENEIPHSLKMKVVRDLKMKIADVPCGKIENENPHIGFENEN